MYVIQKWKKLLENGKTFIALLTDLSTAFDCFSLKLIIGKLNAYGYSLPSSKLIHNYSPNWKQKARINSQ